MGTFLDAFRRSVSTRPNALAVGQGAVTLSYAQLDSESTALAHHLRGLEVGPEVRVGLMLPRSPEMVVGLLAILKAGGAYVPLDPELPDHRLAYMLSDSRPAVTVTIAPLLDKLPADARTVCLDRDAAAIATHHGPIDSETAPDSCAYVIYTSGSTGRPKGVEIIHAAVVNLLEGFLDAPGMRPSDVVLAHTTLSFDIAVIELWLPLYVGARIVLAGPHRAADGRELRALIEQTRATFVQATPSTWRMLLDAGWRSGDGVVALSGGEPLTRELADGILATRAALWNVYGPTETTVWSTLWRVAASGPILIGHPIRNTELRIVDEHLAPVADGEVGELCIGGAGLARGYLHRPDLTAERFPICRSGSGTERMYRTGDCARSHGDDGVECLGRIDDQLKVDGFRIEPGEIESVLSEHPGVKQVIVAAVDKQPGDRRLVAYIVASESGRPAHDELRELARRRLPRYMVPSMFVALDAVPLTPNRKIDRRGLPAPDWSVRPPSTVSPDGRTPLEHQLTRLWQEVLGIDHVGIHDSFFDVGGRSRLGAQLFARIESETGVRLPLAILFESSTISRLAAAIDQARRSPAVWPCLVPVRVTGSLPPLFCVHPVGGNVLAYQELAHHLQDVPCYGLQSIGLDGVTPPLTSVEAMAQRYIADIRAVQPDGPYHLAGFSFGGAVAFEIALRLREVGERVALLALLDTDYPDHPTGAAFAAIARSGLFRQEVYPVLQRARLHARSLRRLGPLAYGQFALGATMRGVGRKVRGRAAAVRGGIRTDGSAHDSPQPPSADRFSHHAEAIRRLNTRAAAQYVPRAYDGTVTYFRALGANLDTARHDKWRALSGAFDLIDVTGAHSDLRREPQVRIVAHELCARITTAALPSQASSSRRQTVT